MSIETDGSESIKMEHGEPDVVRARRFLKDWQVTHDSKPPIEMSQHGYPVVDLLADSPEDAIEFLTALDEAVRPVYHGMQNNEYRREAGMPDVTTWESLDPAESHQLPERRAVYATTNLRGGLVHATLENMKVDANPRSGETYSLRPEPGLDGTSSFIEVSPHLDAALRAGEERFTDGLLYVLPAYKFTPNPKSTHEVISKEKVVPLMVVRVSKNIGPSIVMPEDARWVREN